MCASCQPKSGIPYGLSIAAAIPVPLALGLGFLVPGGEDRLLLWVAGTLVMFTLHFRQLSQARRTQRAS